MFKDWLANLRQGWRKAFSLQSPYGPLDGEDHALLERLAEAVAKRGLATPALLYLQGVEPLGSITSQAMVVLGPAQPIIEWLFRVVGVKLDREDYERLTRILDRREGISAMIEQIERLQDSFKDPLK